MLQRIALIAQKLKLIGDTVILSKKNAEAAPKFLFPSEFRIDLPEFADSVDEEKLKSVFGRILYAYLLKVWTPLRYSEEIIKALNEYCAGIEDLFCDVSSKVPKDANAAALVCLEQLKRIESNISRIETFVLTKHNQCNHSMVVQLLALKTELLTMKIKEEEYRERKDSLLDKIVDYNLETFRPSIFFLLSSPSEASRASISPQVFMDKSLNEMLSESVKATPPTKKNARSNERLTIDDLMALAVSPPKKKGEKDQTKRNYNKAETTGDILDMEPRPPKIAMDKAVTEYSGLVGKKKKKNAKRVSNAKTGNRATATWETELASPFLDSLSKIEGSDDIATSNKGKRSTVQFGADQLAKLEDFEKMRSNSTSSRELEERKSARDSRTLEMETFSKTVELKKGHVTLEVQLSSVFVCANSVLWCSITTINQTKGKVNGIEMTLRDPSLLKVLHVNNCVASFTRSEENKKDKPVYPFKLGSYTVKYALSLPFLPPVEKSSRYTLTFSLFGGIITKKDPLQVSIPIAVVEREKLYMYKETQVFYTPFDEIQKREFQMVPKILTQAYQYFQKTEEDLGKCFRELEEDEKEAFLWVKDQFNCLAKDPFSHPGVNAAVVANIFKDFFMTLPEPIVPVEMWSRFKSQNESAMDRDPKSPRKSNNPLKEVINDIPNKRRLILDEFLECLHFLEKKQTGDWFEVWASVVVRPAGRSTDSQSITEMDDGAKIFKTLYSLIIKYRAV